MQSTHACWRLNPYAKRFGLYMLWDSQSGKKPFTNSLLKRFAFRLLAYMILKYVFANCGR